MTAPIGNTCPDIDFALKSIKDAKSELDYARDAIDSTVRTFVI